MVRTTLSQIEDLAERIERAYQLRRQSWRKGPLATQVWSAAAAVLLDVHERDQAIPADPELFVASQPMKSFFADPWIELAGPNAGRRYRNRVASIVRRLRNELTGEVRFAKNQVDSGRGVEDILTVKAQRLSPLGCFIIALRAGELALAGTFIEQAVAQHNSCPLYRQASRTLLPPALYPVVETSGQSRLSGASRRSIPQAHLN